MLEKDPQDKVFAKLGKMGIQSPSQLLMHLPHDYLDCRVYKNSFADGLSDESKIYQVTVTSTASMFDAKPGKPPRLEFRMIDTMGNSAKAVVFGAVEDWKRVYVGQKYNLMGKLGEFRDEVNLTDITEIPEEWLGKVIPRYKGKKSVVSSKYVSEQIFEHMNDMSAPIQYLIDHFDGMNPSEILNKANLTHYGSFLDFFNALHKPDSLKTAELALKSARQLSAFEIVWLANKRAKRYIEPRSSIPIDYKIVDALIRKLPFQLTSDQQKAVTKICDGLISPYSLFTMLSGDVGTGKTAVFGITAAASKVARARVAILLPNLLLVKQTKKKFNEWWPAMQTLALTNKSKIDKADLEVNPVIIGTSAMFSRLEKEGWVPDYLIVDEQAKFSVGQRERLVEKHTNLLEATATCVPRSAALVMNGGMDLVILKECPVKKKIISRIIDKQDRERLISHIRKVIEAGGQAAVLYPNVKVSEKNIEAMKEAQAANKKYLGANKKNSVEDSVEMWEKLFPGRVGLLHGKMTDDEKIAVIDKLDAKEIDLLLSTTIIETGMDTPSLRTVAVIDAGRFGIAQLHQIRGRVARAGGIGYFFMYLPKPVQEEAIKRLHALENESDGFVLADLDMEQRGFGDISEESSQQSGVTRSGLFTGIKITPSDLRRFIEDSLMAA